MIETRQQVIVAAPIAAVWDHARDMERWARLMPGMRAFEAQDADNSRWTLKIGVGGLVRTVVAAVRVDEWAGPGRVLFSYAMEGDPVVGGGSYHAVATTPGTTEMTLEVRVVGSGPLAPMWEAMCRPLLPRFARKFAEQLRDDIEQACAGGQS